MNKQSKPTANIAISKSRLKVYDKKSEIPTYYLKSGQEFEIELFNPTQSIILAKITLNSKAISQGGLVLKPGQRVFLDRYLDVAKKFKFDTYEVSNTQEVKEAIENNGDFKVDFYTQYIDRPYFQPFNRPIYTYYNQQIGTSGITPICGTLFNGDVTVSTYTSSTPNLDVELGFGDANVKSFKTRSKKTIETGRVEEGGSSDQTFNMVDYKFYFLPFHTVQYKLLPESQKINTVSDVKAKRHCTNCGAKADATHKFCGHCGTKI